MATKCLLLCWPFCSVFKMWKVLRRRRKIQMMARFHGVTWSCAGRPVYPESFDFMSVIPIPEGSRVLFICLYIIYLHILLWFTLITPSSKLPLTPQVGICSPMTYSCMSDSTQVWVQRGLLCSADLNHFFTSTNLSEAELIDEALTRVMNPATSRSTRREGTWTKALNRDHTQQLVFFFFFLFSCDHTTETAIREQT